MSTRSHHRFRLAPLLVGLVAVLLVAGCSSGASPDADGGTTSTTPTTAERAPTADAARALGTPTTLAPLVAETATTELAGEVGLDELQAGDCVDITEASTASNQVATALRIACDQPHQFEIFHAGSLDPDPAAPYPGDDAVLAGADAMCLEAFPAYVGAAYVDSSLEIAHLRPDQAVWAAGDRIVRCALQDRLLQPLVGTVQGSAR
jgi:Septum formation